MNIVIFIFFVLISALVILIPQQIKKHRERIETEQEEEAERDREKELRERREYETFLKSRAKEFGALTKKIHIDYDWRKDIYVYEDSHMVFILGRRFSFDDILSCTLEKKVTRGKIQAMETRPNRTEMLTQELLWGMGKKYNVSTETRVYSTPDEVEYIIYIGLNSLSDPQISFRLNWSEKANEVNNLMNAIISRNDK